MYNRKRFLLGYSYRYENSCLPKQVIFPCVYVFLSFTTINDRVTLCIVKLARCVRSDRTLLPLCPTTLRLCSDKGNGIFFVAVGRGTPYTYPRSVTGTLYSERRSELRYNLNKPYLSSVERSGLCFVSVVTSSLKLLHT